VGVSVILHGRVPQYGWIAWHRIASLWGRAGPM
jgi:hypothetical protein